MIIYIYDIKFKNKKQFSRIKRRFYYNLNKLEFITFISKSVIQISEIHEKFMDSFFSSYSKDISLVKIKSIKTEIIY